MAASIEISHPIASDLAIQFFTRFSRFEYALKYAGFRLPAGGNGVKADWRRFSEQECIAALFPNLRENELAAYLINNPPKRRILIDGNMDWADADIPHDMNSLTAAIARVRNNLFHGDKTNPNLSRNVQLLSAGKFILDALLEAHTDVRLAYEIGLENA